MKYTFYCYGHKNILGKHISTFEFTKDSELSLKGDCIIGVRADFDLEKIKPFLKFEKLKIIIKVGDFTEEILCQSNKDFNDNNEIVVRRSEHSSKRTFGIKSDKACVDFHRGMAKLLQNPEQKVEVILQSF